MTDDYELELITASKVANALDISVKTLTTWYKWYNDPDEVKPDNMPILPDYKQKNPQAPRYWKKSDIKKIKEFKMWLPRGRNGVMGNLTNQYSKKKGNSEND
jgi:hypothetical protein